MRWLDACGLLAGLACGAWVQEGRAAQGPAPAAEAASQKAVPQMALSAEETARLVAQLDADAFSDREAASERLSAAGKAAFPALAKAAVTESLEVTVRAIDILRKHLESADSPTKQAAQEALETIARSERPSAAWRARQALRPKDEPVRPQDGAIWIGPGAIAGAAVQIAVGGGPRRMTVRTVNGVKEIDVEENDRKIKIHDDPRQGIKVEITTTKNGKDTTEKYEAKDAAELKKRHPQAYEVYQKYSTQQPGAAAVAQVQILPGNAPAAPPPQVPAAAPANRGRVEQAVRLLNTLKSLGRQVEQMLPDAELQKAPAASKEELRALLGELQQQFGGLEKKLGTPPQKPAAEPPASSQKK